MQVKLRVKFSNLTGAVKSPLQCWAAAMCNEVHACVVQVWTAGRTGKRGGNGQHLRVKAAADEGASGEGPHAGEGLAAAAHAALLGLLYEGVGPAGADIRTSRQHIIRQVICGRIGA